jgi:hypothetical protein
MQDIAFGVGDLTVPKYIDPLAASLVGEMIHAGPTRHV